jgi:two-component system sensor histidine kinase VanS
MPSTTLHGSRPDAVELDALKPKKHRLTVRARLALTYAGLVTIAGVVLLTIVAFVIGVVPTYEFAAPASLTTESYSATATAPDVTLTVPGTVDSGRAAPMVGQAVPTVDQGLIMIDSISAAVTVSSRGDMLQLLLWVSAGALLVLAAGGAWAGWFVAGKMLQPLQYVNAAAHRAASGKFDHRIALTGPRDEISELADNFDEMLAEIEQSVDAHRRFAANASHELRTPLATTRTMLDVAISTAPADQRILLQQLRETNERSIDTVESLLDLAEIESVSTTLESVDLARLAASVVETCTDEAATADVRVEKRLRPAVVAGDPVLLRQLLSNLVQNAIRHNESGGTALVSTSTGADGIPRIEVTNDGELIPGAVMSQLADPFFRSRGRTNEAATRGRGLGLSIVAAIATRHGAVLELSPRHAGGLGAEVRFPAPDASPAHVH